MIEAIASQSDAGIPYRAAARTCAAGSRALAGRCCGTLCAHVHRIRARRSIPSLEGWTEMRGIREDVSKCRRKQAMVMAKTKVMTLGNPHVGNSGLEGLFYYYTVSGKKENN